MLDFDEFHFISINFISNLNDDCSQLSFELYNVCVAQKLQISEFLIELFFNFFSKKVSEFVSNLNDVCSQLSFEVYNVL